MSLVSDAYPKNDEYTTMLDVIGVSVTMEYTAKMLYENSIGRVFSWFSNGTMSDEERVIVQAQRAYSDLIYDKAWYEFSFMPWVKKVWTTSNTAESNWVRKMERMMFFTAEFTFKAGYAMLIEWAAKANYEEPVTDIYLLVASDTTDIAGLDIVHQQGNKRLIRVPRWGTFTKEMLKMADRNIDIIEVAGNDEILVSVLAGKDAKALTNGVLLYASDVVTTPDVKREVYLVPVSRLLPVVREANENGIVVEHIFDY